jgi:ubiquinone/menaquinone biosynthesis C-methylase UbiE
LSDYFDRDEYSEYLRKNYGVRGYDFERREELFTGPGLRILLDYLPLMEIKPEDRVLEVGCGFGRVIKEIHDRYATRPYGVDVSPRVVREAMARVGRFSSELKAARAEHLSYADQYFDKVLSWGVFDLTDQTRSLMEMSRVTKLGGLILITGKNDSYCDDDQDAYEAEKGARRKGIPNHFTDFKAMLDFSQELGLESVLGRYFERRGQFAENLFQVQRPEKFYEYLNLFRKTRLVQVSKTAPRNICSKYSKTFLKRGETEK